jgi:hypothetical protein
MHGLTGGSWKRSDDQATVTKKNDPYGKPRGHHRLRDLSSTNATAPVPDPPVTVGDGG